MKNTPTLSKRGLLAAILLAIAPVGTHAQMESDPTPNPDGKPNADLKTETTNKTSSLSASDQKFVEKAAQGNMLEIETSELAVKNGTSTEVKDFGKMMVTDHGKAGKELKSIVKSKGVTLPTELDEKHKTKYDKLAAMSGSDFDKAYSKQMVTDHEKMITLFETASQKCDDAELKAFATSTLPKLKEHLEHTKHLTAK